MSTQLFLTNTPVTPPGLATGQDFLLATSRGSGVQTSDATPTGTGPISVIYQKSTTNMQWWYRIMGITISQVLGFNLWGFESANTANVGPNFLVQQVTAAGVLGNLVISSSRGTEYSTTLAANPWNSVTPASVTFADGDWIRITARFIDTGGTQSTGKTSTMTWNGTAPTASGDSYATFTENLLPFVASAALRPKSTVVSQAVQRSLTRCQKLTKRSSGLFVPAEWEKKIMVPA